MKSVLEEKNRYILRFDKGEEVIAGLAGFCAAEKIGAAFFSGIGAADEMTISHYDIDAKKYSDKDIKDKLEIVSLTGNVAAMKGETIIHAHGSFSDREMNVVGGHVKKLIVGPTAEIFLTKLDGKIEREHSDEIGLNLMS